LSPSRRALFLLWASVSGFALALSVLAARDAPLPGDEAVLRWLQARPLPGQGPSEAVRAVTTTQVVLATGALVALALAAMGRRREALALGLLLVALPLLQWGIKEAVGRPRPGPPMAVLRAEYSSPSFPAGHVMSPTAVYGYLLGLAWAGTWPSPLRLATAAWSGGIVLAAGPPNVWLGVHWPSDVLGGWAWGLALALPALLLGAKDKAHHLLTTNSLPKGTGAAKLEGGGGGHAHRGGC